MVIPKRHLLCTGCLLAALAAAGCDSNVPSQRQDPAVIDAALRFPPAVSITAADVLSVSGRVDTSSTVSRLAVNGIAAQSSDGFATWRARVPLQIGRNVLSVQITDNNGLTQQPAVTAVTTRVAAFVLSPDDIAVDEARHRILFTDPTGDSLSELDPSTGYATIVSDALHGQGPWSSVRRHGSLAVAPSSGRILLATSGLLAIELATGDRTIVSDATHGTGPSLANTRNIAFDAARNRTLALVIEDLPGSIDRGSVVGVDMTSGNRLALVESGRGAPGRFEPADLSLDPTGTRILATNPKYLEKLLSLDFASGTYVELGYNLPANSRPGYIALDSANNRAFVATGARDQLGIVDLQTGSYTPVSTSSGAADAQLRDFAPASIALMNGTSLIAADATGPHITSIDPSTGSLSLLNRDFVGSGAPLNPGPIALDAAENRLLVLQATPVTFSLVAVSLSSGNRSTLSDAARGAGPAIGPSNGIALDKAHGRLLVSQCSGGALIGIDLASGNRSVLSTDYNGEGVGCAGGIALDASTGIAYVTNVGGDQLAAVDLTTGLGKVLSDRNHGAGPMFVSPLGLCIDASRQQVLVTSTGTNEIIAVNLTNGNRALLSGPTRGSGTPLEGPQRIVLDRGSGTAYVAHAESNPEVLAINIATGDRLQVSTSPPGPSAIPRSITDMVAGPEDGTVLVADALMRAATMIDVASGAGVVFSR